MPKKEVELYVACYDLHYPMVHQPTVDAMLDFVRKNPVAGFVWGGDQFDNSCISHHNRGKGLYKLPGQYAAETRGFDTLLKQIEGLLPKTANRVWIEGNHDNWEFELVETHPELQGTIERPLLLGLKDRGWKVIPMGKTFKYGELTFVHGETLTGVGNQASAMHAKKAIEIYCTNILYGHMHAPQSFTKVLPSDTRRKWMSWCSPIAGDVNPKYLENRPTAWLNGFTIIEFHDKGLFNVYPVVVIDGKFSYGGKIYGGK